MEEIQTVDPYGENLNDLREYYDELRFEYSDVIEEYNSLLYDYYELEENYETLKYQYNNLEQENYILENGDYTTSSNLTIGEILIMIFIFLLVVGYCIFPFISFNKKD